MSSHQDPHHYPGPGSTYYGSGSAPVARRSHSPGPSCIPGVTTEDLSSYTQPHQSMDQVGNQLEAQDSEDTNFSFGHFYSPQENSFQGPGAVTDATYSDNSIHFYALPYHYVDYGPQSSYAPYDPSHDISTSFSHPMNDLSHSFSVPYHTHDIYTPQTSQVLAAPVYPSLSSAQLFSLDRGGPVYGYGENSRSARPSLIPDSVHTASGMELPNTEQHSHSPAVATSLIIDKNSAPGPSRPHPSSPERKRLLPLSTVDEYSTGRRVVPRSDRAWSVHSTSSDSHRRNRSTDVSGRGSLVPQYRYTTSSVSTYNSAEQSDRIAFSLENPNQIGIPIADILNNRTDIVDRIWNRTESFDMGKKTFTLRVQWPGYKSWSKTIAALDWKKSRAPITRVKLAEAVATAIRDLIKKKRDERCDPDSAEWNLGTNGIQLDQLCLVALQRVSKGSWQPQLCLLEPRR